VDFAVLWMNDVLWVKTAPERQQLADDLVARGFAKTTQRPNKNDTTQIEQMATEMANGSFDWGRASIADTKIIVDSNGVLIAGNHRVIAATLAQVPIPAGEIVRLSKPTPLDSYEWTFSLPPPAP
jgi:hypothetical protein